MRKLNRYKLLLVYVTGLLYYSANAWAHDINNDGSNEGNGYKPDTIIASQYSVSDDFENLGKPADIGC